MLDFRAQSIHSTALISILSMLLIFGALKHFVLESLEDETQCISVSLLCATISKHDLVEVIERSLERNLIAFVLDTVSMDTETTINGSLTSSTS